MKIQPTVSFDFDRDAFTRILQTHSFEVDSPRPYLDVRENYASLGSVAVIVTNREVPGMRFRCIGVRVKILGGFLHLDFPETLTKQGRERKAAADAAGTRYRSVEGDYVPIGFIPKSGELRAAMTLSVFADARIGAWVADVAEALARREREIAERASQSPIQIELPDVG